MYCLLYSLFTRVSLLTILLTYYMECSVVNQVINNAAGQSFINVIYVLCLEDNIR